MNAGKSSISIATGTLFVLLVSFLFHGGWLGPDCTVFRQFFHHSVDALSGTPWVEVHGPAYIPFYGFDGPEPCELAPSVWESWLTEWGPICILLFAGGAITFRRGNRQAVSNSAIASAIAAGVVFGLPFLAPDMMGDVPPVQSLAIIVWATVFGGVLGLAGGMAARGLELVSTR